MCIVDFLCDGEHHLIIQGSAAKTTFVVDGIKVGTISYELASRALVLGNSVDGKHPAGAISEFQLYRDVVSQRYMEDEQLYDKPDSFSLDSNNSDSTRTDTYVKAKIIKNLSLMRCLVRVCAKSATEEVWDAAAAAADANAKMRQQRQLLLPAVQLLANLSTDRGARVTMLQTSLLRHLAMLANDHSNAVRFAAKRALHGLR